MKVPYKIHEVHQNLVGQRPVDLWNAYFTMDGSPFPNDVKPTSEWDWSHLETFRVVPVLNLPWTSVVPKQVLDTRHKLGKCYGL